MGQKVAQELNRQNSNLGRSTTQCSTKAKQLEKQYEDELDRLQKSEVRLESEDEGDVFIFGAPKRPMVSAVFEAISHTKCTITITVWLEILAERYFGGLLKMSFGGIYFGG